MFPFNQWTPAPLAAAAQPGGGKPTATDQRAGSIFPLIGIKDSNESCGLSPATGPFWRALTVYKFPIRTYPRGSFSDTTGTH